MGITTLALLTLGLLATSSVAQEQDCVCFDEILAVNGLRSPTLFVTPPDTSGKKYISEQLGFVWILDANDVLLPDPFLDLTDTVLAGGEQGFLSMAFHPDYANNRQLYIYYSMDIAGQAYTRLSAIETLANNPDAVNYTSERALLEIQQPFANHNGGDITFGSDGYMYFSVGDGGFRGDPQNNGQDLGTYLGKMLRLDVIPGGTYAIPVDNPFLSDPTALPEIYAYGLRNPWRISMDLGDRGTGAGFGRIYIADVGQDEFEEVSVLSPGANFGWRAFEAENCFDPAMCPIVEPLHVPPVAFYDHSVGQCVTGGYVYRGALYPNFNGWYFFADYSTHKLFRMIESSQDGYEYKEIFGCSSACTGGLLNDFGRDVQAFGQDQDGEVYFVTSDTYSTTLGTGRAFRIVDPTA